MSLFQPGKLTEAFKYFLQGMGYSKYAFHVHRFFSYLLFFSKLLQIRCSNVQHNRCDVLYQIQRDMSWVNLPLCFLCHIFSVAYVKDRRLSGGPGTSSSLFTSDLLLLSCLMTLASWNLFLTKVGHEYNLFWAVVKLFLTFAFIYDSFLWSQRHSTPFLFDQKYFFLLWKNIPPSLPFLPPLCHCISSTALCMAFSYLWAKALTE